MNPGFRRPFLLLCLLIVTFLPLAGSWLHWGGMPPGYGAFPPQRVQVPPGFNLAYFAAGCGVVFLMVLFLVFPRLFGFRPPTPTPPAPVCPLPFWFIPGVLVMLISWALMWFGPVLWARFTFVPLWWGCIYTLDGIVYARAQGRSIMRARKNEMLVLAIVSVVGWYLFEYWNYFALGNWYYPHAHLLTPFGNLVWYTLSYTTVWPVCFEMYMVLMTIPALRFRWAHGPKITLPPALVWGVLVLGAGLEFGLGLLPYPIFWALWIGALLALGAAVELAGFWTPFAPAAQGNWSRFMLMALGTFLTGFIWEFWNFGSQAFRGAVESNPNYWVYDVPYMNVLHFFSEMPLLGYFGYLFFGVLVWAYWLVIAHLVDLDPDFAHQEVLGPLEETSHRQAA
jgi:hypothetical protein